MKDGVDGWRHDALCAYTNPSAFFPEIGQRTKEAKSICARCPVKDPCLEYSLRNEEKLGIWGGLDQHERRKLLRKRKRDALVTTISAATLT